MAELDFRSNNFDLIRLCAALQVMFLHAAKHLQLESFESLMVGLNIFPGVPIFFVISGYLISASLENSTSLSHYYQNRVLRIYPGLWVCFAMSLISVYLVFSPEVGFSKIFPWILSQLTIGQFYNPDFLRNYGVGVLNGSLWTIPVELQFYLLLPVIYLIFRRLSWNSYFIGLLIFFLIVVNQYYFSIKLSDSRTVTKLFGVTLLPYLYMFLLGTLLQKHRQYIVKYLQNKAVYWLVIYIASVFIMRELGLEVMGNSLNPVSAILLALLVVSSGYSYTKVFSKILRGNDISYGVYIYHMVVINMFVHLGLVSDPGYFFYAVCLTIIIATVSWKMVEKPALKLKPNSLRP